MTCINCGTEVPEEELNCPSCGAIAARTPADLQKTDPGMTRAIALAVVAMGVIGLGFVIGNSWTDWYSGLDYIAPAFLILVGGAVWLATRGK